jgi:hypothetical protein
VGGEEKIEFQKKKNWSLRSGKQRKLGRGQGENKVERKNGDQGLGFRVPLKSWGWVGVHLVGFVMFWPTVEKLLNIEHCFHWKFI